MRVRDKGGAKDEGVASAARAENGSDRGGAGVSHSDGIVDGNFTAGEEVRAGV